jgi:hypothetical protein
MNNNYFNSEYGMGSGYAPNTFNLTHSNVVRVTSLDEAIMQTTRRPSDMVYFNQDKDEFYNVKIDYNGHKTWATFTYNVPNPDANTPVSKAELNALVARLDAIEARLGGDNSAESNG